MKRLLGTIGAVGGLALAAQVLGPVPLASAKTPIDVGPVSAGATVLCNGARAPMGNAWVTLAGDWVTVNDACDDGRAVEGRVGMVVDGKTQTRRCIAAAGAGWKKECNFNWHETGVGMKTLAFYYETAPGSGQFKLGTLAHWRDG